MKKIDVRTISEIIGVISIVSGLIFVGLQIKLSQDIALSQSSISYNQGRIEAIAEINDHIEIWEKGNAEENLSSFDYAIYLNLVDLMNDLYFYMAVSNTYAIGEDPISVLFTGDLRNSGMNEWAYFLYKNPGALKAVIRLENESLESCSLNGIESNQYLDGLISAIEFYKDRYSNHE